MALCELSSFVSNLLKDVVNCLVFLVLEVIADDNSEL